jgi:hypothetical protein
MGALIQSIYILIVGGERSRKSFGGVNRAIRIKFSKHAGSPALFVIRFMFSYSPEGSIEKDIYNFNTLACGV